MRKAMFILPRENMDLIYGPELEREVGGMVELAGPRRDADVAAREPGALEEVEIVMTGWGAPQMDEGFLNAARKLKAVFYGAGSIRWLVTEAFWERGIVVCSAWGANAVPVAEFTLGQILLCLKRTWHYAMAARRAGGPVEKSPVPGGYHSTVGIISLGMIGRMVCNLLQPFDVRVIAYDPFVSETQAAALHVTLRPLADVFREADVVSLHTPWLKETEGMIRGEHFASMKAGASFINTARGAIVNEAEMVAALQGRPDVTAVLDVTHPEPPVAGSPLYAMDNVMLTPHIAGSMGPECRRMGRYMVDELRRYLAGEPLSWQVSRELAAKMA